MTTSAPATAADRGVRDRILQQALRLIAERGSRGMSMRQLASACELNPATLYHYFGSKDDIVQDAIAHRRYGELMSVGFPVDASDSPEDRLASLLRQLWTAMLAEEDLWRALLGESLRGHSPTIAAAIGLTDDFEAAIERWLRAILPEVRVEQRRGWPALIRAVTYGFVVDNLLLDDDRRPEALQRRATETARVLAAGLG